MHQVETLHLSGRALNWALSLAVGKPVLDADWNNRFLTDYQSDWSEAGPILQEHWDEICVVLRERERAGDPPLSLTAGRDLLPHLLRTFVRARLGDVVSVPNELMEPVVDGGGLRPSNKFEHRYHVMIRDARGESHHIALSNDVAAAMRSFAALTLAAFGPVYGAGSEAVLIDRDGPAFNCRFEYRGAGDGYAPLEFAGMVPRRLYEVEALPAAREQMAHEHELLTRFMQAPMEKMLAASTRAEVEEWGPLLQAMRPIEPDNLFWMRHGLPEDTQPWERKVGAVHERVRELLDGSLAPSDDLVDICMAHLRERAKLDGREARDLDKALAAKMDTWAQERQAAGLSARIDARYPQVVRALRDGPNSCGYLVLIAQERFHVPAYMDPRFSQSLPFDADALVLLNDWDDAYRAPHLVYRQEASGREFLVPNGSHNRQTAMNVAAAAKNWKMLHDMPSSMVSGGGSNRLKKEELERMQRNTQRALFGFVKSIQQARDRAFLLPDDERLAMALYAARTSKSKEPPLKVAQTDRADGPTYALPATFTGDVRVVRVAAAGSSSAQAAPAATPCQVLVNDGCSPFPRRLLAEFDAEAPAQRLANRLRIVHEMARLGPRLSEIEAEMRRTADTLQLGAAAP